MNRFTRFPFWLRLGVGLIFLGSIFGGRAGPALAHWPIYVTENGTGDRSGSDWTNAATLQHALSITAAGDEIWVATGVYTPGLARTDTFTITSGVQLYGGFAATETLRTQRDWVANPTILSGDIGGDDTTTNGVVTTTTAISGSNIYHVIWADGVSAPITATTIVDGFTITAGQAGDNGGGFYCAGNGSGHECSPSLTNVTFSGNSAVTFGGAMYNDGSSAGSSSPSLTNVTFSGNSASYGGAMFNGGNSSGVSSPNLTNVTFIGNSASSHGGAMYNYGRISGTSSPSLTSVTFTGNSASYGGAMYNNGSSAGSSSPSLTNVTFSSNQASGHGGAMFNYGQGGTSSPDLTDVTFSGNSASNGGAMANDGTSSGTGSPRLTNVTFSGNSASTFGGAMYNNGSSGTGSPRLINVTFSGNSAGYGGAMFNDGSNAGSSSPSLTNVIFNGNSASFHGGAMFNGGNSGSSSPSLTNVTVSGNWASQYGGAIYNNGASSGSSSPGLTNVILWGNRAGITGNQLFNNFASPVLSYTLIQSDTNDIFNSSSSVTFESGIRTTDPLFVAPVAATAVPTTTGNYRLQAGSPAIDAGLTGTITLTTDLDGSPRLQNGTVDLGAYEGYTCPSAGLLYVDQNAAGGNGQSWANAFTNLQTALSAARTCAGVNEIWVAAGVYTPGLARTDTFTITSGVQLYGGFAATETQLIQRDWAAHPTILSGDIGGDDTNTDGVVITTTAIVGSNSYHVIWADGVTGDPITATTIVDGFTITAGQAGDNGGGFYCAGNGSGHECSPSLTNVTFSGNSASSGGAMYNNGHLATSSPKLSNVIFTGNSASANGGAMYNNGYNSGGTSSPSLSNVTFSGNSAGGDGGAMYNNGFLATSSPSLSNVTFSGNSASKGGAMVNYSYQGVSSPSLSNVTFSGNSAYNGGAMVNDGLSFGTVSPSLTDVTFSGNSASANGGAMYNSGNNAVSRPSLSNVTFSGNSASYGGAMYNYSTTNGTSSPSLSNVTFSGNSASSNGGAMFNYGSATSSPRLVNVIFGGNSAGGDGGAMYNYSYFYTGTSSPSLTNVTFSGNSAFFKGGAMVNYGDYFGTSSPSLTNVILWGNQAGSSGHQLYNSSASPVISYTLIQSDTNDIFNSSSSVTWGPGIRTGDPLFVASITATAAPTTTGNYRLLPGSLAIDAGLTSAITLTTDLDGNSRVQNGTVDLGAYEGYTCPNANPIYVDQNAAGGNHGDSWANAFPDLQTALSVVRVCAGLDEIWVATGVYTPGLARTDTFTLTSGVQLYGGFAATETQLIQRDWAAHPTILSGDIGGDDTNTNGVVITTTAIAGSNSYHVIWADGVSNPITATTIVDGFTITAGQANGSSPDNAGGGFYCAGNGSGKECSPSLSNVTFSGNSASSGGGAMFNNGSYGTSSPRLTNVTFSGNSAGSGGAMFNSGFFSGGTSSPTLSNVTFSGNSASSNGGAMLNNGGSGGTSSPSLSNVTFSGNSASGSGGAMYNSGSSGTSSPRLTNVTFSGNSAGSGGAMFNNGISSSGSSSPRLSNVTFSGNRASSNGGAMVNNGVSSGSSSPRLTNVILWGNQAATGNQLYNSYASPVLSYTLIQSDTNDIVNSNGSVTFGPGILTIDSLFVAPITATAAPTTTGNYRLRAGSPAIDAGFTSAITLTTDLDGNARIQGTAVDLGAYEWTPLPLVNLTKLASPETDVPYHGTITYTLALANGGAVTDSSVTLTDTLPAGASFANWIEQPSGANFSGDALAWSGAVGPAEVITFTFAVSNTASGGVTITNTAWFSGSEQADSATATYTTSTILTPSGSGNWSEVFPPCTGVCSYVIPNGVTVTLDQNIGLSGNLTIEPGGAFIPNGKTVTLTGDQPQTLTGNPLTFYNLVVNKTNATDIVTVVGKLKVAKKMIVRTGRLISASDYGDIEIDINGELVLTNTITIGGNLIVSGTLTTNDNTITFDGGVGQSGTVTQSLFLSSTTSFGDINVLTNTLLVETNSGLDGVALNGALTNYGTIRKTQPMESPDPLTQYYFGLAGNYPPGGFGMEINVTNVTGGDPLSAIQVDRIDKPHPNAPPVASGIYWTITPTGADFIADVSLPHNNVTDPLACRYTGSVWDCANDGSDTENVTYGGSTAFSDWAVFTAQPVAVDDTAATSLNSPVVISPLANDYDLGGGTPSVDDVADPPHGTAVISGTTQITYTPDSDFSGSDVFTYTVLGGNALTDTATITVTVLSPPDVVIVTSVSPASAQPGDALTYTLIYSNTGGLTATGVVITDRVPVSVTNPAVASRSGAVITQTGTAPNFVWQVADLAPNEGGVITLTGVLSNPLAAGVFVVNSATITSPLDSDATNNQNSAVLLVLNAAPLAADDSLMVRRDDNGDLSVLVTQPITIPVLVNDTDPNSGNSTGLTVSAVGVGSQDGAVSINANNLWVDYTPTAAFTGTETFTYTARDSGGLTDTATVTVTVVNGDGGGSTPPDNPPTTIIVPHTGTNQSITVTIQIPAGVATDTFALVYNEILTPTGAVPHGLVLAGLSFTLDAYLNQILQPHPNFTPALTLTLEYSDADVADIPQGEGGLQLLYWTGSEWSNDGITVIERDTDHNRLVVTIAHLTEFALFGSDTSPIYLPLIAHNYTTAPDLVITGLSAAGGNITVTLKNQGNAPVTDAFWVDVYFNPNQLPALNKPWNSIAPAGATWGVPIDIPAGGDLTLTSGGAYYFPNYSSSTFPAGAQVYGYVDSVDHSTSYGAVRESDESNNLFGPIISTTSNSVAPSVGSQSETAIPATLPGR